MSVSPRPDDRSPAPLELYDDRLPKTPMSERIELALELERRVLEGDPRIVGLDSGADYGDSEGISAVVSTSGVRCSTAETGCALSVYSIGEADGDTSTGFGFSVGRQPGELDVASAADEAVRRTVQLIGAKPAPSERLTVVLDPWVTAQFLMILGETFSAEEVLKHRSLFGDRLGERASLHQR